MANAAVHRGGASLETTARRGASALADAGVRMVTLTEPPNALGSGNDTSHV
ncbi:MAG: hypothetical protein ACLT98_15620 [Eggerthellaceae bacterium]